MSGRKKLPMNRIILTICFATLSFGLLAGCRKEDVPKENIDFEAALVGSWELRHTSSAWLPAGTNHAAGNGNLIKFTNSTYEKYTDGQLVKSGTYSVIKDSTVEESVCLTFPEDPFTHRIIYDNDYSATKEFIEIVGNKLTFISGCYAVDAGHSSVYEKQ
jgi:hypothetical protein